jgi:hypothetical protein
MVANSVAFALAVAICFSVCHPRRRTCCCPCCCPCRCSCSCLSCLSSHRDLRLPFRLPLPLLLPFCLSSPEGDLLLHSPLSLPPPLFLPPKILVILSEVAHALCEQRSRRTCGCTWPLFVPAVMLTRANPKPSFSNKLPVTVPLPSTPYSLLPAFAVIPFNNTSIT